MRRNALLLLVSILTSVGFAQTNRVDQTGYIYCAKGSPESTVSAFLTACLKVPVGNFSCGDKVEVIWAIWLGARDIAAEWAECFFKKRCRLPKGR